MVLLLRFIGRWLRQNFLVSGYKHDDGAHDRAADDELLRNRSEIETHKYSYADAEKQQQEKLIKMFFK